jgi:uncharacterized protein (DUF488 family)
MKLFTIGFTKTSAEHFFERLGNSGAKSIVDVRLNNVSQLAGFAKRDDLKYFARKLCGMDYRHFPELAPTKEMLDSYRETAGSWSVYERQFLGLMAERAVENIDPAILDGGCLLCSEDKPHRCHRRLVAEYLKSTWPSVEILHL